MQLSRLLFLTPEKTYERKIKEVILAFQIEKNFTKEEIFTLYCNQIYFGHGNYGVEAASQFFFGKPARDVTLAEAALLAGLPQNPSRLSPPRARRRVLARRNHVLDRMAEEKYISTLEAETAKAEPITLRLRKDPPTIAPYFLEEVRKYLEKEYGSQRIYQGGLRVYTTLDPEMQRLAVSALRRGLRTLDRRARGFVRSERPCSRTASSGSGSPRRVGLALRGRGRRARSGPGLGPNRGRADRRIQGAPGPGGDRVDAPHQRGRGAAAGHRGASSSSRSRRRASGAKPG